MKNLFNLYFEMYRVLFNIFGIVDQAKYISIFDYQEFSLRYRYLLEVLTP